MKTTEFRALTAEELVRAAEQPKQRTKYEKAAYRLLPKSMKMVAEINPPTAFKGHKAFYPDLLFHEDKFLIEIDGEIHWERGRQDRHRNKVFEEFGYTTIRIKNKYVCNNVLFWSHLIHGLCNIPKEKRSVKIAQYIKDLNELIEKEMLSWTQIDDDYEENWFVHNYDQMDFRPYLFYNVERHL